MDLTLVANIVTIVFLGVSAIYSIWRVVSEKVARPTLLLAIVIALLVLVTFQAFLIVGDLHDIQDQLKSQASLEVQVGFGPARQFTLDKVHQAPAAGIVSATVTLKDLHRFLICGYVYPEGGDTGGHPKQLLATASTHYSRTKPIMTHASISMPVKSGQSWIVTGCGGSLSDRVETTVFYQPLVSTLQPHQPE